MMKQAAHGEYLMPLTGHVLDYEIGLKEGVLCLTVTTSASRTVTIEAEGVISFRFTEGEGHLGVRENDLNRLLVVDDPPWQLAFAQEEGIRGDFVRRRQFFHMAIDDVGTLECFATRVRYDTQADES